ncbi:MAG: hypothetical protein M1838_001308 [Thelocarpon superellum]|nr:MAG: hypothetical protein M1838_001308 [Thelocarpon superellum]
MIVPAHVNLKYWFYPTGNTPAVNLFRQLPALDASHPTEEVEVLLLACGDPRSLLFSLWCVDGHTRNSILLALIIDEGGDRTSQASWDLFYHLYVPQSSLSVLQTEVAKLLSVSESPEAWNSSPYGRFLRFLSWDTLREVRQIWLRYAQTWHFTAEELQQYETRARAGMEDNFKKYENTRVLHGVRSAGAMWSQAAATMSHAFARYWASGVVAGNAADVRRLGQQGRVNPMFATSSAPDGGFAVHYGTEPLLGFNLAEAFESVGNGNNNTVNHEALDRSVRLAKTQIQAWSTSLAHFVRADRIRIRLFCGDAVRLCQELERPPPAEKGTTFPSAYTKQWSFRPLVLDGEAWPHSQSQDEHPRFDVVDTSNLIDHVGAMTVLASAAPLLSRKPTSVLYTESLLLASEDVTSTLPQLLSSDTTTFSLAMGLTPIGHVIGYTTDEVGNEGFMSAIAPKAGRGQYRIRVSWGFPGLGDLSTPPPDPQCAMAPVEFDPDQLAAYFFDIYKKMFDSQLS